MDDICFDKNNFMYILVLIVLLIAYVLYARYNEKELMSAVNLTSHLTHEELRNKIKDLQNQLYSCQLAEQQCKRDFYLKSVSCKRSYDNSPSRIYQNPRRQIVSEYQMVGFVYKSNERYPLYGRIKYPGRTDKWEYYIIDETRNRLKIPFDSINDNEILDGEIISIPTFGTDYSVKIYEYEQIRYNPNI